MNIEQAGNHCIIYLCKQWIIKKEMITLTSFFPWISPWKYVFSSLETFLKLTGFSSIIYLILLRYCFGKKTLIRNHSVINCITVYEAMYAFVCGIAREKKMNVCSCRNYTYFASNMATFRLYYCFAFVWLNVHDSVISCKKVVLFRESSFLFKEVTLSNLSCCILVKKCQRVFIVSKYHPFLR